MTTAIRKIPMGFTLLELMIVVAIIGTLAGISIPVYGKYIYTAKVARTKAEIRVIEKEITAFMSGENRYPTDLAEIGLDNMLDPFGNPYRYLPSTYIAANGKIKDSVGRRKDHNLVPVNTDFDLYSMGRDGLTAAPFTAAESLDDIVRANNGLFVGLVSAY